MPEFKSPSELLDEVTVKKTKARKNTKEISGDSLIKKFLVLPEIVEFSLNEAEVMLIARLWQSFAEGERGGLTLKELSDTISKATLTKTLNSLLDRGIICPEDEDYRRNPLKFYSSSYLLSNKFLLKIMKRDLIAEAKSELSDKWLSFDDFVKDLINLFNAFRLTYPTIEKFNQEQHNAFDSCIRMIVRRLRNNRNLSFTKLIREEKLTNKEIALILLTINNYCSAKSDFDKMPVNDMLYLISKSSEEYLENAKHLTRIITNDIIDIEKYNDERFSVSLSDSFLRNMRMQPESDDEKKTMPVKEFLELVKVKQTLQDLIIPEDERSVLQSFIYKQTKHEELDLSKWGFNDGFQTGNDRHKGFVSLFYGVSGTGKTYAAGAIANALGKDLMMLDCSKLRSCFYGMTQKRIKDAFRFINEMNEELDNPPVFLINEADQLIHKRSDNPESSDSTENAVQNIILEELENFSGVMILTTNLKEAIDDAYFRRFNLKIEFKLPDYECRKQLWSLHLNKKIPGVKDIDIEELAGSFILSGGQISMIIQNACTEAIGRPAKHKRLTQADLIKYAEFEAPWQKTTRKRTVGF